MNMDNTLIIQLYFLLSIVTSITIFLIGIHIYKKESLNVKLRTKHLFNFFKYRVNIRIEDCISFEKYKVWRYSTIY